MRDELPPGWATTTLAELLVALESGSRPRGGVRGITEGVPSLGGEHLKYDGKFDFTFVKYVPEQFAAGMTKGRIQTNDILVVKDGATTGKTAFVDSTFPFRNAVVNEHVFICRPTPEVEPKFLFRFLTSKDGQERILENFKGSAQGGINQTFAPRTEVPLAPLAEQRRIVAKLETLLGKVDACQQRLAKIPVLLKRFRQSVLATACSGRLTADWREENPEVETALALLDRTCGNKARSALCDAAYDTPAAWVWVGFGAIVRRIRGGSTVPPQNEPTGYPILRSSSVRVRAIDFADVRYVRMEQSRNEDNYLCDNDLLFTRLSGSLDFLANCALVRGLGERRVQYPDRIFCAKLQNAAMAPYIEMCFADPALRAELTEGAKSSAGHQRVSITDITGQRIPVPPLAEQQEIVRRVEVLFTLADQIEARFEKARAQVERLTPSLLTRAFRGELVPQDPADEPASALLERVRRRSRSESGKPRRTTR